MSPTASQRMPFSPRSPGVAPDNFAKPFICSDGQKICIDSPEFDSVKAMDMLLGEVPSVEDVKHLVVVLQQQIGTVNKQVLKAVRAQSQRATRAHEGLAKAQDDITQLNDSIQDIERCAHDTEESVDTICKDIRMMDHAKRHLTTSISTLENFGTLTEAVSQLEANGLERSMYAENAEKLEGVVLLMEKFENYNHVTKMAQLKGTVDTMARNLHSRVKHEFEITWVFNDPLKHFELRDDMVYEECERMRTKRDTIVCEAEPKFQALKDSCKLASALGNKTHSRQEIVDHIVSTWIKSFVSLEVTPRGNTPLDEHFKSLFQWLKNVFTGQFLAEQWKVVPDDWHVQRELALAYCTEMKKVIVKELALHAQLSHGNSPETASEELLAAMQVTRQFESFLQSHVDGKRDPGNPDNAADAAKLRLLAYVTEREAANGTSSGPSVFAGILTDCFADFLQPYIDYERSQLLQYVDELLSRDAGNKWKGSQVASTKLDSAHALLTRCRDVADRCSKVALQGSVYVRFTAVVNDVLEVYASKLKENVPAPKTSRKIKGKSTFAEVEMDTSAAERVCNIVASAEYCDQLIPQMVDYFCTLCDESLASEISLDNSRDSFESLSSVGMSAIINGLLTQLVRNVDGPLPTGQSDGIVVMATSVHAWQLDETGDTSKYARTIAGTLKAWGHVIYKGLVSYDSEYTANELLFWHVCQKVLHVFIQYLLQNGILKLRKMNNFAVQQLMLDVDAISDALRTFPIAAFQTARLDAQSQLSDKIGEYQRVVKSLMSPVVNLMKVLAIHDDQQFIEAYRSLLPREFQSTVEMSRLLNILDMKQDQRDNRILAFSMHGITEMPSGSRHGGTGQTSGAVVVRQTATSMSDLAARSNMAGWTMPSGVRNMASMRASGANMLTQGGKALKATTDFGKKGGFSSFFKFGGPAANSNT